ncbi:FecCD family ABC transporter permease [Actinomadura alba]|nr:iron ABC transporter permease [Actinomadura alba]
MLDMEPPAGGLTQRPEAAPTRTHALRRPILLVLTLGALVLLCLISIAVGSRQIPLGEVVGTLLHSRDTQADAIVWGVRVPRTALGLAAGAALGLAGAVMQALTRNPLADPGLMGVSAGSALGIVVAIGVLGIASLYATIWFAFTGALVASVVVYVLGGLGRGGTTPVKLALAGVAVTFMMSSLTGALALISPEALNRYRFWSAGSLAGQDMPTILRVLPFLAVGALLALAAGPALNNLSLGDDVAASLGRRPGLVRLQGLLAVTLLTGGAVAVVGPIVFVGLVVPHAARIITGPDQRWLLPFSMLLAPCLLLMADIAGRVIARPQEVQVGIVVAFVGAPFFIALVRRRRLAELTT